MHILTYLFAVALWAFWLTIAVFQKLIDDVIDRFWHEFLPDNNEVAVFYFVSCRNSFIFFPVLQLPELWDLVGWWISKEEYIIFVCFALKSPNQEKLPQMIGFKLPFEGIYDSVSLFSRICENRKGNIRFLTSKMYLDILLLQLLSLSIAALVILKWFLDLITCFVL